MKKIIAGVVVALFVASLGVSSAVPRRVKMKNRKKIVKTKRQIVRNAKKKRVLKNKLKKQVKKAYPRAVVKPKVIVKPVPVIVPRSRKVIKIGPKKVVPKRPRSFTEIELGAGYVAGIPGVEAALRFNNPLGMVASSLKTGVIYAVGKDTDSVERKHALVVVDGIYHMAPMFGPGVKPYFGLGLNYNAYTTGKRNGAVAYQAYLGLQGRMSRHNSAYLEVGYGYIRTGFSPQYKGLHSIVGVKAVI